MDVRYVLRPLVLLVLGTLAVSASSETVPAFLWSSETLLTGFGSGTGIQSSFETISSKAVINALSSGNSEGASLGALSQKLADDSILTILVPGQATRSSLGLNTEEAEFIQSSVQSARSSVYLANVEDDGLVLPEQTIYLGSCEGSTGLSLTQLKDTLKAEHGRTFVSVCEDVSASEILELQDFVKNSKQKYIVAYFGQPDQELERPVARSLLATSSNAKNLCDGKCQAQVRLFETIILLVILLSALWVGMNMLHILDSPSRFETEKKEQSRHQD